MSHMVRILIICLRGSLGIPFIHVFVSICWRYRMIILMPCCISIAPSSCKDDINASAVCHIYRFSSVVYV